MIPISKIQPGGTNKKNWVTKETKEKIKLRDNLKVLANNTNNEDDWSNYRKIKITVTDNVRKDRKGYFENLYSKADKSTDTRELFRITREQLGWSSGGPPSQLVTEGKLITKPRELDENMNNYFIDKIRKLRDGIPARRKDPLILLRSAMSKWEGVRQRQDFELREVTLVEVSKTLGKLKKSTTMGHDKLDAMALKLAATSVAKPLQHILNNSIRTQIFCNKWKLGKILPLHKGVNEDKTNMKSYRPISILPVVSKLMERVIQKQVLNFMDTTGQFNRNLHAYRQISSTTTAALQITDYTMEAADLGMIPQAMLLDQSAAFDCVSADILDSKMELYGFSENTRKWLPTIQ